MANSKTVGITILILVIVGVAVGVGVGLYLKHHNDGGGGMIMPYVTPPVVAACPPSLKNHYLSMNKKDSFATETIDATDAILNRFFVDGPTNLFGILSQVDQRVQGINDRMSQFTDCMASTPTAVDISTGSWPTSPTFYISCAEVWQGGAAAGFDQWGQVGATSYLYVRGGDGIVAAQLVGNGTFGNIDSVTIWFSVGVQPPRNGSHCVAMVYAEPARSIFEMSVAGANVGWCGVQMKSDGVVLNVTGSEDGPQCGQVDTSCTSASSVTTPATCNTQVDTFSLPALGRMAYPNHPASEYPGGAANKVFLNNTGLDDAFFGPTSPSV